MSKKKEKEVSLDRESAWKLIKEAAQSMADTLQHCHNYCVDDHDKVRIRSIISLHKRMENSIP